MDRSYKRKNHGHRNGGGSNWSSKKRFNQQLRSGMKGFLCTCNTRESDCIRESLNVLNEYADKLEELQKPESDKPIETTGADAVEDIEDELKKEVLALKSKRHELNKFSVVDTGVKNNIFITTKIEDPLQLARTIMNDVAETKKQKGRFLMRIVPVEETCKAYMDDIKNTAETLFGKHFCCEPTTFAIVVNKRYNDNLLRDEVIEALALLVTDRNKEHKANLTEPKLTVLVEILKGVCCLSVLEDYKRLRHYNIAELAKPKNPDTEKVKEPEVETEEKMDKENDEEVMEKEHEEIKKKGDDANSTTIEQDKEMDQGESLSSTPT